ncbi:hypothetical protein ACJMK2_028482 [Sinanodonta woodiana]|uniref:DivIVA domain-containing protein n=1 Tax=Sinanodonta woodiana TaxID=1069815 RepID=A0ABD3X7B0_SINWO
MATDRQLVREFKSIGKDYLGYEGQQLAEFVERCLREHKQQVALAREKERQAVERAAEQEREGQAIELAGEEKAREKSWN